MNNTTLTPNAPLSQATGDVAASDWQIIQEINQDKAIIQELNISAKTDVAASEGHVYVDTEPIHSYFGLSYANYLVLPRSVLQSMPIDWQDKFVTLLDMIPETIDDEFEPVGGYQVQAKDGEGKFKKDPYSNYERGRRRLDITSPIEGQEE